MTSHGLFCQARVLTVPQRDSFFLAAFVPRRSPDYHSHPNLVAEERPHVVLLSIAQSISEGYEEVVAHLLLNACPHVSVAPIMEIDGIVSTCQIQTESAIF